jgi:hypothetical protein
LSAALEVIAREGALLVLLLALGAGPASLLSERFDAASRIALAPVLGFCVGTCAATTLLHFAPARDFAWALVPIGLVSVGVAVARTRSARRRGAAVRRPGLRDVLQLALVCVAVAGPLTAVLAHRDTVGPAAFYYTDVNGYVAEQDGATRLSLDDARDAWEHARRTGEDFSDRTVWNWSFIASFDQNIDAAPLAAGAAWLLGLGATETFSPFLVVWLLCGALAAFAAVRYATASRTWMAALAGALFGGPFFLELWFDSFQAAIIAIGLVMPLALAAAETLRGGRRTDLVVLALVLATVATVYPLFLPVLAVTGALLLGWMALAARRRGERLRALARPAATRIAALIALVVVLDPVGITRDVRYYQKVLRNEVPLPRVHWDLPLDVIPGWLLQTRGFWYLPPLGVGGVKELALGGLVPAVMLVLIVIGVRRHPPALALVALAAVFGLVAEYSYASQDACTYCAERVLLPLAPIAAVLVALGLRALLASPGRLMRVLGVAAAVLVVVVVGQRARIELTRFVQSSFFLDSANRAVLDRLPPDAAAVHLEGYGQTFNAQAEQPLVYHLANERVPGRVSISFGSNLRNAIQYLNFGAERPAGPEFRPGYSHVLTRFAGIDSGRAVVARSGPIALERRTRPLDVVPYAGLAAPLARLDPSGTAWVQPDQPLRLHVVGREAGPVWARLTFRASVPLAIPRQAGVRARRSGDTTVVCVRAAGAPPVRDAGLRVSATTVPAPVPPGLFPPAVPSRGVALAAMEGVAGRCE